MRLRFGGGGEPLDYKCDYPGSAIPYAIVPRSYRRRIQGVEWRGKGVVQSLRLRKVSWGIEKPG